MGERVEFVTDANRRIRVVERGDPDEKLDRGYREVCDNGHEPQAMVPLTAGASACPVCSR